MTSTATPSASAIATRLAESGTLADLFLATAAAHPGAVALRSHETGAEVTYAQARARVGAIAGTLRELGVAPGEPVALMLRNRPEFHLVDTAVMMLGAVPFSLYNTSAPDQLAYVLADAGVKTIVTESAFVEVLEAARGSAPAVERLVLVDENPDDHDDLLDELAAEETAFDFSCAEAIRPDDLLTLIYTSGTTGPQKGVELTHEGMLTQLRGVHAAVPLPGHGRQISFLPAAHVADRWTSHYSGFMAYANTVTCVADMAELPAALAATRPTQFGAVPRVWEKLKAALETGYPGDAVADSVANPQVAEALRAKIGLDEARWVVTGAAPTPRGVLEFFTALGLPLCEMLGMSEVSCCVATNTPDAIKLGSVGKPLDTVEVRIAEDGEVAVRGPQVMRGYRGAPEKTAEAIDGDGWLHTGDIGRLDEDGYLWIVDRKKELIINAAGKNMSPANIEMAIRSAGNAISHVAVIGDQRPYNVALIVADPQRAGDPELEETIRAQVDRANATLSRVEQIKKYTVLRQDWRPGHELTPTMKLRRRVVDDLYAAEIEQLFA
ncbi:AMP-dependent synthetase/ligase [Dietzia sp. NPDC055340]